MFLEKDVLKTYCKLTGEHSCRSVILIKLQSTLLYGCFPVKILHIFRTLFYKNTFGGCFSNGKLQFEMKDFTQILGNLNNN